MAEAAAPAAQGKTTDSGTGAGREGATATTQTTEKTGAGATAQTPAGETKEGKQEPVAQTTTTQQTTQQAVVPEKYELKIPDDAKEFIDADVLGQIEDMARKASWSNDDAQNAVNEHAQMIRAADAAFLTQLKADKDYGGDKLAETQRLAKSIIDLARPEGHPRREAFMRAINRVAAGNHPEFVSFLADLGRRAAEDSTQQTQSTKAGQKKSAEEVLYGGSEKKS